MSATSSFELVVIIALQRPNSGAIGCKADMPGVRRAGRYDAIDRACVKTHTSAKCRKHNSPARHRTSLVQYDLTPTDAIAQRYFYVWRDRWSFRTAKTLSGHPPEQNPALQRDLILATAVYCRQVPGWGSRCNSID